VNLATTTIVKAGQSSDIHVLFHDRPVSTDVTGLQIQIWNAGKEPIHSQDILEPIIIDTHVPILEATIRRLSRPVTGCTILLDPAKATSLVLGCKILEHNDAIVLQVIIAGSAAQVSVSGIVEGQRDIATPGAWPKSTRILVLAVTFVITALCATFVIVGRVNPRAREWARILSTVFVATMMILNLVIYLYDDQPPSLPLQFI
jgi:hypothetical protein